MAKFSIIDLLKEGRKNEATHLHLKVGSPPAYRVKGNILFVKYAPAILIDEMNEFVDFMLSDEQKEKYKTSLEINFTTTIEGAGLYNVSVFRQRGSSTIIINTIPDRILSFDELNLPMIVAKIAQVETGLVLIAGRGKSRTIAAIINYINENKHKHIITLENHIEYQHRDIKCVVNQREISTDTPSYSDGLKAALREDPDVIIVDELTDLECLETIITASESGSLVVATLNTYNMIDTINRILSVFPTNQQNLIRYRLAQVLKAIIIQRLITRADGKGKIPATEIMISNRNIRECITDQTKTEQIRTVIAEGNKEYGMHTFDQCLYNLYKNKSITYDEAILQAVHKDDLALMIRGVVQTSDRILSTYQT